MNRQVVPVAVLFGSLPGVRPTIVPWGDGLPVLFGPNGSGKTMMLRAIQAVFTGTPEPQAMISDHPAASLIVRVGRVEGDEHQADPTILASVCPRTQTC